MTILDYLSKLQIGVDLLVNFGRLKVRMEKDGLLTLSVAIRGIRGNGSV